MRTVAGQVCAFESCQSKSDRNSPRRSSRSEFNLPSVSEVTLRAKLESAGVANHASAGRVSVRRMDWRKTPKGLAQLNLPSRFFVCSTGMSIGHSKTGLSYPPFEAICLRGMENDNLAKRTQFFLMNSMTGKTAYTRFTDKNRGNLEGARSFNKDQMKVNVDGSSIFMSGRKRPPRGAM